MFLTKHETPDGPRWARDGFFLPKHFDLGLLLALPASALGEFLAGVPCRTPAAGRLLAPVDPELEIWAAGVTYLRSREAREAESSSKDVYARVYDAERPELFFKAIGRRVVGPEGKIRIRRDSRWNVPEPELVLVFNAHAEIVGFTAGNDVSSRDIEGDNPLYLPQAKIYDGSCAIGASIELRTDPVGEISIELSVVRSTQEVFRGGTNTGRMKRRSDELVHYLTRELEFPRGGMLFTGTGIVPPEDFSLEPGDRVTIQVGSTELANTVSDEPRPSSR
jgi:2-dehydro-3-deoxy-D-arabinonate dehydratase